MSNIGTPNSPLAFRHGPKPVIGLIGAIGAGKSTVALRLNEFGGFVIDADKLGHEALTQPEIIQVLVTRWGSDICKPDGSLDRRAIAKIVFNRPEELQALESVVFPFIRNRCLDEIARGMQDATTRFVVLDAAVLLEAGWSGVVDRIVYVDAPRELRLQRLAQRSGWTDAELANREAVLWPAEQKKALANAVIVNDADPATLDSRIKQFLLDWKLACL